MKKQNVIMSFDAGHKVAKWPKKTINKHQVLQYLFTKFELGKNYSEREVNQILEEWHTFKDSTMLRRALVDQGFMSRRHDGSEYWINEEGESIDSYKIR